MPANDDNQRDNHTVTNDTITEQDMLGIVEGTITPERLRAIRDTLAADKQLLSTLARMKRDRETLQSADHAADPDLATAQTPASLVHDAVARAANTTLGFDELSEIDAIPDWPSERSNQPMPTDAERPTEHAPGRVAPGTYGHRRHFGWKARTALAASIALVIAAAFGLTALVGALDPDRRTTVPERPRISIADEHKNDTGINEELIEAFDAEILKREQLADELMKLIDRSGTGAPPVDDLGLDTMLAETESIDEMLARIAEDLIRDTPSSHDINLVAEGAEPVRRLIDTSGISVAAIGRLARAGRMHVSLESRNATQAAVTLLNPNANAGYTAELITFAEMDSAEWTNAVPIARGPAPDALPSPPSFEDIQATPEDPQLARVQQLLRQIRERDEQADVVRESTDPVYQVTIARLGRLDDEAAGLEVIQALERVVSAGDRIAFYELAGAEPLPGSGDAAVPGFTVQMYVRDRGRR